MQSKLITRKVDFLLFSALCAAIIFLCPACGDAERTTHIATAPEDVAKKTPDGRRVGPRSTCPRILTSRW